ncbi:hypothetical protein CDAR_286771 [Caerostris darwini]|uniref:Uncharacterized protein n=1 Tax=Caerostris darwini TaxID=1538125 RepID=A0AAV4R9J8_9ARAC|nr:hypothetical protein CDAR_286771 [Caerostris darwini]
MIHFLEPSASAELPPYHYAIPKLAYYRQVSMFPKISPNFIPLSARDIISSSLDPPMSPGQSNNCAKSHMHSLIAQGSQFHTPIDLLGELKERLHASLLTILIQRSIDGA